ncbi:MAG TPA: hypothetical protein VK983_04245 [Candidatus Limnocylindrales bacterium]|nr:hypothetical protein [Candidatus Limnocylindrales bacterium]
MNRERISTSHSPRIRRASAVLAGGFGLSACGLSTTEAVNIPANTQTYAHYEVFQTAEIGEGAAYDDEGYRINIRYDGVAIKPRGEEDAHQKNNACYVTDKVDIPATRGYLAEQDTFMPNGPFVGIPLDRLPKDVQDSDCSQDADGIVWIAGVSVHAPIKPTDFALPQPVSHN